MPASRPVDARLRERLLELERRERSLRRRLADSGELFEGYSAAMERVHHDNARCLGAILDRVGWPGESRVGADGAEAAWLVAQHAIGLPAFQRRCRELLAEAVSVGEAPCRHLAQLVDRIRFSERRPQRYGTVVDWDENGELSAWPVEDPEGLEDRRRAAGLPPHAEAVAALRRQARLEGETPPASYARRQREIADWARRTGWLGERADAMEAS